MRVRVITALCVGIFSMLLLASALGEPATTKPVELLDRLDRVDGAVTQVTPEGLQIASKSKAAKPVKVETTAEFKVPLVISAVAKTDSANLRLFYGSKGTIILNWHANASELRRSDPKTGEDAGISGQGAIAPATWVAIDWTITDNQMRLTVDGVERLVCKGDYAGLSGTVGIGTFRKSVVTVKSLAVTQYPPGTTPEATDSARPAGGGPAGATAASEKTRDEKVTSAPAPADPDAIERPEFRRKPKPLLKSLASVTAMMVTVAEDGQANGATGDIIAMVPPESRESGESGIGFVHDDGDRMMKTTLDESTRAITLRYPKWEAGHIDISFGEKFVGHGGPSAGIAFGLLQLACLEGFEIDPKCAVTGDISVDWSVRKVGGVGAKLRGATLDKCLYALIPEDNQIAFADMGLLYGRSSWWDIQVFSIATLQQAVAMARTDRKPDLAEAIRLFADLQAKLKKSEQPTLRDPQTVQALQQILKLAPNHLSARNVLAVCQNTAPKSLSSNATIYQLSVIFYPYREALSRRTLDRTTLPPHITVQARKRLLALRPIANRELRPLVADVGGFIEAADNWAGRPSVDAAEALIARAQKLDARIAALDKDPNFYEKLIREAY